jgi:hypothetical protein
MEIIELREDSSGFVMARDCHLDSKKKDTVKWKNDTDTDYIIHFDKCPFRENHFTVFAHSEKGPIELDPKVLARTRVYPKTYAYEIRRPDANSGSVMAADPNVIVH